jgi:hypothetical protein
MFVREGLCRVCYMDGETRMHFAAQLPPDVVPPPPERATSHLPGSEGKIAVMTARLEAGQQIFHPDDNSPWVDQWDDGDDW